MAVHESSTAYRMYKFRLYRNDQKDKALRDKLFVASLVWNHFIALQKRYYRLTGKYISLVVMNQHVLKLRKTKRFGRWKTLHSQVCQNVCRRIDEGYQRFFKHLAQHPPKFRKAKKYRSFMFPQSGYVVDTLNLNQPLPNGKWTRARGAVRIDGQVYKFVQHRPLHGTVKTLTVKRDAVGRLWLVFCVEERLVVDGEASTGKSGGFDFGLKRFLTDDEGRAYSNPEFFRQDLKKIARLSKAKAHKVEGSKHYKCARPECAKQHAHIADKRRDFHFKLAHQLCDEYDVLYFEDLNLDGMKRLWGRKVSDLGFANFLTILKWVALKRGKSVVQIGRFERTTQRCSGCAVRHPMALRDRVLTCTCGLTIDRDHNAAINIQRAGASAHYRSDTKTPVRLRSRIEGRSPRL